MTRIWADVYDAAGTRLGAGPVTTLQDASVVRALDGVGQITFSVPASDKRAVDLLTNERRVQIYQQPPGEAKRLLAEGIIRKKVLRDSASGVTYSITGPDILDELKRVNTWFARIYSQETLDDVMDDLISLAPGWTVSVDAGVASEIVDARFDGASVMKAMQAVVQQIGVHFRLSATVSKQIEVGAFGEDDGRRINKVTRVTAQAIANDLLLIPERVEAGVDSEDIWNRLAPIGAGEGQAALTLEQSTRTTPYTIQTDTMPDGSTMYYIEDSASIATYGAIEKPGQFKEIAPLDNTDTDIINAANALYDAAVAYLQRHKDPQDSYVFSVKNVKTNIAPGSKINVRYKGRIVNADGVDVNYVDLNQDMWVMEVNETVNLGGVSARLTMSSVDRYEQSAADVIIGTIERVSVQGLKPQTYPLAFTYSDRDFLQGSPTPPTLGYKEAEFVLDIDTSFTYVSKVVLRFDTLPLFAPGAPDVDDPLTKPIYWNARITKSSNYPAGLSLYINGVDRTSALGGPWGTVGAAAGDDLDITEYIVNASGGLRQRHTIVFKPSTGSGDINYPDYKTVNSPTLASSGVVKINIRVLGSAQAILPS